MKTAIKREKVEPIQESHPDLRMETMGDQSQRQMLFSRLEYFASQSVLEKPCDGKITEKIESTNDYVVRAELKFGLEGNKEVIDVCGSIQGGADFYFTLDRNGEREITAPALVLRGLTPAQLPDPKLTFGPSIVLAYSSKDGKYDLTSVGFTVPHTEAKSQE